MTEEINYPEREFKARGGISSAIWRTQSVKNGRTIDKFSIKLQKRYKDPATGEWKGSEMYLFPSEIPALLVVANRAYQHCVLVEKGEDIEESIPA
jgi:hypothetical protein